MVDISDQWDLSTKTHFSSLGSVVLACGIFRVRFGCEHGSAHGIWSGPKSRASLLDMIMIDRICFILITITLYQLYHYYWFYCAFIIVMFFL